MNANTRAPRGARVFAFILGGLILAVLAWAAWRWSRRSGELTVVDPAVSDTVGTGFRSAQLWFVARSGESLVSEPREVIDQTGLHERVAALLDELVRGPAGAGLTLLPAGTTLRHVYLDERGLLTLDLSGAFRSGFGGGAGAEELAVGALVRTLGDNLSGVKCVVIVCEGVSLASVGGHLPLDRPLDPADWP
jgi:spore germination protein GerM